MRILAVRIGRAGDIVMTTPALSAIFDQYPDAEVTVLTGPDGRRLLNDFHPGLHEIWVWNRSGFHNYFDKRKIQKKLTAQSFDLIFCFDTSKHIAGLFKDNSADFYSCIPNTSIQHCAQNYLTVVEQAAGTLEKSYFAYLPVNEAATKQVDDELLTHGISPDDVVIMLHPSYSGYTANPIKAFINRNHRSLKHRLWPAKNFAQLAELLSTYKCSNGTSPKIIIDLIPEEAPLGENILSLCHSPITLLQVKPNFERYKALIKRANLLVVPNTGPMHIAAAVKTRVVALFSNWNPKDCGPYMDSSLSTIVRAEDMPEPDLGLAAISPQKVLESCKALLP